MRYFINWHKIVIYIIYRRKSTGWTTDGRTEEGGDSLFGDVSSVCARKELSQQDSLFAERERKRERESGK